MARGIFNLGHEVDMSNIDKPKGKTKTRRTSASKSKGAKKKPLEGILAYFKKKASESGV